MSLTAGDGVGPWWVIVQKGFGPIYVEQVGLAVTMAQRWGAWACSSMAAGRLLGLDGERRRPLAHLPRFVGSPLRRTPGRWTCAGLAVTADISGWPGRRPAQVRVGGDTEYLGLLLARLAVYGMTVYGGYGEGSQTAVRVVLPVGAVNGPIGGPPAFFVTGIGGGFGINRRLKVPTDFVEFGDYPLIQALDPAARPGDPMAELQQLRVFFPAERGTFWFAAGRPLPFRARRRRRGHRRADRRRVRARLLGLARMALPRPQVALVSVELGLLARVSSKDGVVLVQAQLTDNSWLLFPAVRLTGGFAFATWFAGLNGASSCSRSAVPPGLPARRLPSRAAPRAGVALRIHSITRAVDYFALTSEAVMAGAGVEASASFGWLGAPRPRRRRHRLLRPVLI